jgi:CRISPR-associated endonuclease/helicase Cas3
VLSISLLPQDEYRWKGDNPSPETFPVERGIYPLYHQWRTCNSEAAIIVNTHNTGTGKTKAALLRLRKRAHKKGLENILSVNDDVLLIAPTNELIQQHTLDAKNFCEENGLPYRVLPITHDDLLSYKGQPGFSEGELRLGAAFHGILNDASRVYGDTEKRATIFVVNPDIFYYAVYSCYNKFDKGPLANTFIERFNYIIIDEFHYYNPKQFAAFLFFIKLSHYKGYIERARKQRQFCILTATPRPEVERYLNNLGVSIEWIKPGEIQSGDEVFVEPVYALTSVQLEVYSTEKLQEEEHMGGLLKLVEMKRDVVKQWLTGNLDGAIISSSLGAINNIHQALLPAVPGDLIGRVTGAQQRGDRREAKEKRLILATPTVDIGYNFERSVPKSRQNIDFLLFDAYSGDEFIQRLGRAGRVLAKEEKHHESIVLVVVDPASYKTLQKESGKQLMRTDLSTLAQEEMPRKNDLSAYTRSGSILEIFRPIMALQEGVADERQEHLNAFLHEIRELFTGQNDPQWKGLDDRHMRKVISTFDTGKKYYGQLREIPHEAFEVLPFLLDGGRKQEAVTQNNPSLKLCLEQFYQRLKDAWPKLSADERSSPEAAVAWLQRDLRSYYREKTRFSFRDGFQAPLALISDPNAWHSDQEVNTYNALHIVKYYYADFYATYEEWMRATGTPASAIDMTNVLAYCRLRKFRHEPLRLGLKLDARHCTQDEWEEQFAYQVTSLHGLKIVTLDDHEGLDTSVQCLLYSQFVPAFVAQIESRSGSILVGLRKTARFYPMQLEIMFSNGQSVLYRAVLGSMAFQVCAEIPYWAITKDRRDTQRADDEPLIC